MQAEQLVEQQLRVEVSKEDGVTHILLSDGQQIVWPGEQAQIHPGTYYLSLTPQPILPTKTELAKLVLQEILKIDQ